MKSNEEMIRCVTDQIHEKKQKAKKQQRGIIFTVVSVLLVICILIFISVIFPTL